MIPNFIQGDYECTMYLVFLPAFVFVFVFLFVFVFDPHKTFPRNGRYQLTESTTGVTFYQLLFRGLSTSNGVIPLPLLVLVLVLLLVLILVLVMVLVLVLVLVSYSTNFYSGGLCTSNHCNHSLHHCKKRQTFPGNLVLDVMCHVGQISPHHLL